MVTMPWFTHFLTLSYRFLVKQTEDASHQLTLFGIVMMIYYPLFGVFWKIEGFELHQEYILRVIATLLCAVLAANKFWPNDFIKLLPFFWYIVLLFCLPFFFAYMSLMNHGSTLWLMNGVSALFFLFLVTSVLGSLVLLILGVGLSFFCYYSVFDNTFIYVPGHVSLFSLTVTYTAAIIIGALFARDREIIHAGRLLGMRLMAGSIAHDLRTPLASIHLQAELQELMVDKLNHSELRDDLKQNLHKINRGIEVSHQLISMQLNNIQQSKFDTRHFTIHAISELLQKMLDDYPLKEQQRSLIHLNEEKNFSVWMDEIAFKNLMWNLLKNSFEFIQETGKGDIYIWLELGEEVDNFNYLHVKDTAKGVYEEQVDKIFDYFYSDRKEGTGLGLAYCRQLMQSAGGDITCKGKMNEFAHFIVKFPKID